MTVGGVSESDYIDLLLEQQVAGIIFAGGQYMMAGSRHDHYARLTRRRLPVVTINASIDGLPFARVVCDDDVAAEQALEHVISLGHKRIGFVMGPEDHLPTRRKLLAYRRIGEAHGLPVDELLVEHSDFTQQSGQSAAARILANGATALVCASDPLALGAIRAVRRAGLEVPGDVSVVGYDDSAFMAAVDPPPDDDQAAHRADRPSRRDHPRRADRRHPHHDRRAPLRARARRASLDRTGGTSQVT